MSDGRLLVTAVCVDKHHVLGELVATDGGDLIIRVPRAAVVRKRGVHLHRKRGGKIAEPFDVAMSYMAVCGCGVTHLVSAGDLDRARHVGESVVPVAPMR